MTSAKSLQRAWRQWVRQRRTTAALAAAFAATGILSPHAQGASTADFDAFTAVLQAPRTLRTTAKWLQRLDVMLCRAAVPRTPSADQLLRRLFPASRAPCAAQPPRFPARVVLCAWMVVRHPDWVLRDPSGALEVRACHSVHHLGRTSL